VGGRNGNGGGQKCDEDCGGSVACVDKRWEKEGSVYHSCGRGQRRARGGQEKRARVRWSGPFEVKAGMAGEGWGRGRGVMCGRENGEERGGSGSGGSSGGRHQPRPAGAGDGATMR
jgi:hypothetical protein